MSYNLFDPSSPAAAAAVAAVTSTQHTIPCRDVTSSGFSRLKAIASVFSLVLYTFFFALWSPSLQPSLLTHSVPWWSSLSLSLSLSASLMSLNQSCRLLRAVHGSERKREGVWVWVRSECVNPLLRARPLLAQCYHQLHWLMQKHSRDSWICVCVFGV